MPSSRRSIRACGCLPDFPVVTKKQHAQPQRGALCKGGRDAVVSVIALSVAKAAVGLRVSEEVENTGLDLADHGEEAYHQARG